MRLKDLSGILRSPRGSITSCIVFDVERCKDLSKGCSPEYACKAYGSYEIASINVLYEDGHPYLLLNIHE